MTAMIDSAARKFLKSKAHHLEPVVQVGSSGLSDAVDEAVVEALERHELIKVRLGQGFEGDRRQAGQDLAERTKADLVQVIGRVLVLYRRRARDLPGRPRMAVPGTKTDGS